MKKVPGMQRRKRKRESEKDMGHIAITTIYGMEGGQALKKDVPIGCITSMAEIKDIRDLPEKMRKTYEQLRAAGNNVVCALLGFVKAHSGMSGQVPVLLMGPSAGIAKQQLTPMNSPNEKKEREKKSSIKILDNNQSVVPLVLGEDQVIQTIGSADLFPHLPKQVRDNVDAIEETGIEAMIVVVAPLDNRPKDNEQFNFHSSPDNIYYYVTVMGELLDFGISDRAQAQRLCNHKRHISLVAKC